MPRLTFFNELSRRRLMSVDVNNHRSMVAKVISHVAKVRVLNTVKARILHIQLIVAVGSQCQPAKMRVGRPAKIEMRSTNEETRKSRAQVLERRARWERTRQLRTLPRTPKMNTIGDRYRFSCSETVSIELIRSSSSCGVMDAFWWEGQIHQWSRNTVAVLCRPRYTPSSKMISPPIVKSSGRKRKHHVCRKTRNGQKKRSNELILSNTRMTYVPRNKCLKKKPRVWFPLTVVNLFSFNAHFSWLSIDVISVRKLLAVVSVFPEVSSLSNEIFSRSFHSFIDAGNYAKDVREDASLSVCYARCQFPFRLMQCIHQDLTW